MKKWLVGLLAAGLCAASAWAAGVATLPLECSYTATQSWTELDGFSGKGVGTYGDGRCKFDSNGDALTVQFDSDPGTLTFELKGNTASAGTAPASFTVESSADGENWNPLDDIDETEISSSEYKSFGPYALDSTVRYVRWTYVNKYGFNFGLNNVVITSGGPVEFSLSLDKDEYFDVYQNSEATIVASVKGAQGDVTYEWSAPNTAGSGEGSVFTIDTAEITVEPHTIMCRASDGTTTTDWVIVYCSIVAAPEGQDFTLVDSADGLQDGTLVVLTDPDGTVALPATVSGTVFAVAEVTPVGNVITTDNADIVWKLVDDGNGNFSLYSDAAAKYAGHAGTDSNSGRLQDDAFPNTITVGEDGLFVYTATTADSAGNNRALQYNYNNGSPRFAYYKGTQKNLRVYAAETGPAEPKVVFSGETTVEVGQSFELQFTLKNYEGDYSWVVEGGAGSISDEGLFTYAPAEAGVTVVMVKALDGEGSVIAQSIDIQLTANEPAAKYTIAIAEGIENGTVTADKAEAEVDEIVTLTITPAAGYKLDSVSVNDGAVAVTGNTFVMPAADVTVSATFVEVTGQAFALVTSLDSLEDGAEYVVTDNSQGYAITAELSTSSTKRLVSTVVAPSAEGVITTDNAAIIWKLVKDDDGNFAFYNASIEKYIGWSSGNSAKFQDDPFANTISYEDGLFVVMATSTAELEKPRKLQFNSAANTLQFAYYEGAQKNLCFFKAGDASALSVSFDQENPLKIDVGTAASVTAVAKGGEAPYAYAWESATAELNGTEATLAIPATLAVGTYTATVTVTDNAGIEVSTPFAVIVSEPAVAHDVKIAVGIQGGVVTADPDKATVGETITLTATADSGQKLVSMTATYGETTLTFTSSPATFEMPDADVYVGATFEEVTGQAFTLVTSLDDLEDGAEYVITDNSQAYAITAELSTSSTKRLVSTAVAPVDGVITTDEAAIIWKLVKDDDGNFALYNASIEKYIGWSSGNSAKFQDDPFANTISYEGDLFVVMATSTAELEKPRKLQFNSAVNTLQFAYYEGAQKNLCFFKASGAAAPSISYEGETTVEKGGSFAIQFTLKNYDGDYAWAVDSREGGTIDESGLYTWTPSESGEVTIKVKAEAGETEIASKEVALTVTAPEPPASSIVCNLGDSVEAAVNSTVSFVFTAQGVTSVDEWSAWWEGGDDVTLIYSEDGMSASFDWVPSDAGSFSLNVVADAQPNNQQLKLVVAVTVSDGEFEISGFSADKNGLSFSVPSGASVEAATNLVEGDWTPVNIAPVDGKVVIPFEGDGKFYRLAK